MLRIYYPNLFIRAVTIRTAVSMVTLAPTLFTLNKIALPYNTLWCTLFQIHTDTVLMHLNRHT